MRKDLEALKGTIFSGGSCCAQCDEGVCFHNTELNKNKSH